ncbi:MAG: hypothetical protein H7Z11_02595 [Verrucomicrobia bacterium]|nr:hypothetical protein [Leptolyngbya sp. ES-bin-22]
MTQRLMAVCSDLQGQTLERATLLPSASNFVLLQPFSTVRCDRLHYLLPEFIPGEFSALSE